MYRLFVQVAFLVKVSPFLVVLDFELFLVCVCIAAEKESSGRFSTLFCFIFWLLFPGRLDLGSFIFISIRKRFESSVNRLHNA